MTAPLTQQSLPPCFCWRCAGIGLAVGLAAFCVLLAAAYLRLPLCFTRLP